MLCIITFSDPPWFIQSSVGNVQAVFFPPRHDSQKAKLFLNFKVFPHQTQACSMNSFMSHLSHVFDVLWWRNSDLRLSPTPINTFKRNKNKSSIRLLHCCLLSVFHVLTLDRQQQLWCSQILFFSFPFLASDNR